MRDSLTILAAILILILTAALVGPYCVDWTAQRDVIEARLSQALGEKVRVRGAIDLKLLPTPYLTLESIAVADETAPMRLSAAKLRLEIAVAPLLHGEVDFLEAALEAPRLDVTLAADGSFVMPRQIPAFAANMRFERIAISNGVLAVEDPSKRHGFTLDSIELDAEARSLLGPIKGKGSLKAQGERAAFLFSTGASEDNTLQFKIVVEANDMRLRADLDGALSFGAGTPSFKGGAKFAGAWRGAFVAALPWRLTGKLTADARKAGLANLELRIGEEDHALSATGEAELDLAAAPKASLALRSGQIDLDHWLASKAAPTGAEIMASLAALDATAPLPLVAAYSAQGVAAGGEAFNDVSTTLALGAGQAAGLRFEAFGPGKSRLALDGALKLGAKPEFAGKLAASAEKAGRLAHWLAALAPPWAPLRGLSFRAIDLAAEAHLSPAQILLRDLEMSLDGSRFSGTLDFAPAAAERAARLAADLVTPSLDLSALPDLGTARSFLDNLDGSLRLEANAVTLGRLEPSASNIGGLDLELAKAGERIELEELTFEGSDGGAITASGVLVGQSAHVDARIDTPRESGLATLLTKIAPGPAAELLSSRAAAFSPADLMLTADAVAGQDSFAIQALSVKGSIGQTEIAAAVGPNPVQAGNLEVVGKLDAKDSLSLLRLFGLAAPPIDALAPGHIELKAHGPVGRVFAASLNASVAGANLAFDGRLNADFAHPSATGALRLASKDLSPLLRATGLAFPAFTTRLPADGAGDLIWSEAGLALQNLEGHLADTVYAGEIAYGKQSGARKMLTGSIDVEQTSAAALFSLALGPPEHAIAGAVWPKLEFSPAAFALPVGSLALTVKRLGLPPSLFSPSLSSASPAAHAARMTLETAPGLLVFHDLQLEIGGARVTGEIKLRREAEAAGFEAHLGLKDYAFDWPGGRGRFSADVDLAGTGKSPAALVGGLAGSGHATLADFTAPRCDPLALTRVLAAFEQDRLSPGTSDLTRALSAELQRAAFKAGTRDLDVSIVSGVLRLSPSPTGGAPDQTVAASLDLRTATLNERFDFTLRPPPKNWDGPPPQITLNLKGPWSNPVMQIDAAALANALAARSIARESAQIELYEFDIHERAFFNQRLLSERRREREKTEARGFSSETDKASKFSGEVGPGSP